MNADIERRLSEKLNHNRSLTDSKDRSQARRERINNIERRVRQRRAAQGQVGAPRPLDRHGRHSVTIEGSSTAVDDGRPKLEG